MQSFTFRLDPRWFQIAFQLIFLSYGIFALEWTADWTHYGVSIGGCLLFQFLAESVRANRLQALREFGRW